MLLGCRAGGTLRFVALLLLLCSSCAYKIGSGVTAGALDELGGEGRTPGVEAMADDLVERALLVELGHQLGQGLSSGVTEITPEQRAGLEATIEGLLHVAASRAGKGLRREVSPELREMVRKDIVGAFSDGLRGELGDSLEDTVDRVVARAVVALRQTLAEEDTKIATSELVRDAVYYAMRESAGGTPAVGETIEHTLTDNMLVPIERSVGGMTDVVALRVEASARRTENMLKTIIGALIVVIGVVSMLYTVSRRQLRRAQEDGMDAEAGLASVGAALDLLDESTRAQVLNKLSEYEGVRKRPPVVGKTPPPAPGRGDDYLR